MILQGSAERVIEFRQRLADELEMLRQTIETGDETGARAVTDALAAGVERERAELTRVEDVDDPRVIIGLVSLTMSEQPVDAVLTASSLAAASVLGGEEPAMPSIQSASLRVMQIAPIGGRSPRR